MKCLNCENTLSGRQIKYCSIKCKYKYHGNSYPSQKKRGIERKLRYIKHFGGCCSLCGYKKNLAALAFHHTSIKNFSLDMRKLSNSKEENLFKELKTCILVCHNCHSEIHNPSLNLDLLL